ncbi:hypothetical protein [Rubripirellula reticaptiva]|uniref:Uncharacterized protein n=1 Tax=Rubripirellula reticaptiva TaxID=2528013 RepID=A0A5C6FF90_9BACT|nr:hypothetical protein [Rubripirellula reticaptiva]TWU58299.1 hypothetical protein Poly59_12100 [Rubripirellula reticaptiva]
MTVKATNIKAAMSMKPAIKLASCLLVIAIIWLAVLPWIGRRAAVSERIDWLESKGIDPSAMYYTELDAMQPILQKLNLRDLARDRSGDRVSHFGR